MFCCCRLLNENKKACPWHQSLYIDRLYKYIFEFIHVQNAYCSLYGEKKLVIIFHLFGTYSVHSGLLSLVWEKVEHRCGYLVIVFCKFKTEYKCPGLYIDINYRAKDIYKEKLKVTWLEASLTFFVNGRTLFVILTFKPRYNEQVGQDPFLFTKLNISLYQI